MNKDEDEDEEGIPKVQKNGWWVSHVACHLSLTPTATATNPPPTNSPIIHSRLVHSRLAAKKPQKMKKKKTKSIEREEKKSRIWVKLGPLVRV